MGGGAVDGDSMVQENRVKNMWNRYTLCPLNPCTPPLPKLELGRAVHGHGAERPERQERLRHRHAAHASDALGPRTRAAFAPSPIIAL